MSNIEIYAEIPNYITRKMADALLEELGAECKLGVDCGCEGRDKDYRFVWFASKGNMNCGTDNHLALAVHDGGKRKVSWEAFFAEVRASVAWPKKFQGDDRIMVEKYKDGSVVVRVGNVYACLTPEEAKGLATFLTKG